MILIADVISAQLFEVKSDKFKATGIRTSGSNHAICIVTKSYYILALSLGLKYFKENRTLETFPEFLVLV
jgi:hypothetical protein